MKNNNKKMENQTEIFIAWLQWYLGTGKIKAKALAKKSGIDPSTISSYKRNRTKPDFDTQVKIIKGVNETWENVLNIGRRQVKTKQKTGVAEPENVVHIEDAHANIIKKFTNKTVALEINQILLEIDEIDPDMLKSTLDHVKWFRDNALKERKKREVRKNEK